MLTSQSKLLEDEMKKRIIALIMALAMVFALCACTSDEDTKGTTQTGTSASAEPEKSLELGSVAGGKYENDYFGFGCELDENWTYATEEELGSMIQSTADNFDDEDIKNNMLKADMFYDMVSYYSDGVTNINVVVQNIGVMYGAVIDTDAIVDQAIKSLPDQLAAASMTSVSCDKITVDFAGQQCVAINMHNTVNGVDVYQLQVYVKEGKYVAAVTFSSTLEDNIDIMRQFFYAV